MTAAAADPAVTPATPKALAPCEEAGELLQNSWMSSRICCGTYP